MSKPSLEAEKSNIILRTIAITKELATTLDKVNNPALDAKNLNDEQKTLLDKERKKLKRFEKQLDELLNPGLDLKKELPSDDERNALLGVQKSLGELKKAIEDKFPSLEGKEDDDDEMERKPYKGHAEVTGDTRVDDPIKTFFAQLYEILSKLPALIRSFSEYQHNLAADRHNKTIDKIKALEAFKPNFSNQIGQHLANMSGANRDGKKVYESIKNDIEKNGGKLTSLLVTHEGLAQALEKASPEEQKTFTHLAKAMYANKDFLDLAANNKDSAKDTANEILDKIAKNIKNPDFTPTSKDAKGAIQGLLIDANIPEKPDNIMQKDHNQKSRSLMGRLKLTPFKLFGFNFNSKDNPKNKSKENSKNKL